MKTVDHIGLTWRARQRLRAGYSEVTAEIEDNAYAILIDIARNDSDTIQGVVGRIIEDGLLPIFSDVIRLRVRGEEL